MADVPTLTDEEFAADVGMNFFGHPVHTLERGQLLFIIGTYARRDQVSMSHAVKEANLRNMRGRQGRRTAVSEAEDAYGFDRRMRLGLSFPLSRAAALSALGWEGAEPDGIKSATYIHRTGRTEPGFTDASGILHPLSEKEPFPHICHHCHQVECICPPIPPAPPPPTPYGLPRDIHQRAMSSALSGLSKRPRMAWAVDALLITMVALAAVVIQRLIFHPGNLIP